MKYLSFIIVLIGLSILCFDRVSAQNGTNVYYYRGTITYSAREGSSDGLSEFMKKYGIEDYGSGFPNTITAGKDIPLGTNVTVIYNDFFRNYKIHYTNSSGKRRELNFEVAPHPGVADGATNGGFEYILMNSLSLSDISFGNVIFFAMDPNCQVYNYTITYLKKTKK